MTDIIHHVKGYTAEEFKEKQENIDKEIDSKHKELRTYLDVIAYNPNRFNALTCVVVKDFGGYCDLIPLTKEERDKYSQEIMMKIVHGMEINGKKGQWSNGFMGSRWFDWENKITKTSCRVAFYSKKYQKDWDFPKPYAITLSFEKSP